MPFVPGINVAQVETRMLQDNQHVENVFYVLRTTTWSADSLTDLANIFIGWWTTASQHLHSEGVQLLSVYVRDLTSEFAGGVEVSPTSPLFGTRTAAPLPNNATLCITSLTGNIGRSFRGRTYWVGMTEDQVVGNNATSGTQGELLDCMRALPPLVAGDDHYNQLAVFSRVQNNAPRAEGVATPITDFRTDGIMDSQRRRLPGRGR